MSLRGPTGRGNLLVQRGISGKGEVDITMYYVYILTNKHHTVLYTGVTKDLVRRVYEHKNHLDKNSFTAKYKVDKLVFFEETTDVNAAIQREKQIKSWSRDRKTSLIFESNPHWVDLYNQILG